MSENKQSVLMVHNYYQIPGGEDTVVANEKKMLEEHGHKVVLYTRNNGELKTMNLFQKMLLPFTTIFNPKTYREIKKIIKKEKIDIVHVHNTLNLVSPSVYYAAKYITSLMISILIQIIMFNILNSILLFERLVIKTIILFGIYWILLYTNGEEITHLILKTIKNKIKKE